MVTLSESTLYENYLMLRRELGEQDNGDLTRFGWEKTNGTKQLVCIREMLSRCEEITRYRDLSWKNYCATVPKERRDYGPVGWEETPLFIKAAIIRPTNEQDPFGPEAHRQRVARELKRDVPESEVTPW